MSLGEYLSRLKDYIKGLFGFEDRYKYRIDVKLKRKDDDITLKSFELEVEGKSYTIPKKYQNKKISELPDADEILEEMDKEREKGEHEVGVKSQGAVSSYALSSLESEIKKFTDSKRRWVYEDEKIYEAWKKKFREVWKSIKA